MPEKLAPGLLSWAPDLEPQAAEQAQRTSRLPFLAGHVALMPDAHFGMGATIGSVIPTVGAIVPAAVGVDIGCGMIAQRLDLSAADLPDDLGALHSRITKVVPAGVGQGHAAPVSAALGLPRTELTDRQSRKAHEQFGTLGSGNHFVEICLDETDTVWVVLHSGSRGIGNELAKIHIEGAKGLMKRYFIDLEDPDLAYLVEGTPEFDAYVADMTWAQDYAFGSRQQMMHAVVAEVAGVLGREPVAVDAGHDPINCHHNYTTREQHHGRPVWLTRKGAIRARTGDLGVIPGSMGAASYIVEGLGNPASYCSCSHGAGRRMSRAAARRELDRQGLVDVMAGKAWNGDAETLIDEDPRAYKDIDAVMEAQQDLVTIKHRLRQILNYKGT